MKKEETSCVNRLRVCEESATTQLRSASRARQSTQDLELTGVFGAQESCPCMRERGVRETVTKFVCLSLLPTPSGNHERTSFHLSKNHLGFESCVCCTEY